jgi:hypothetical protein
MLPTICGARNPDRRPRDGRAWRSEAAVSPWPCGLRESRATEEEPRGLQIRRTHRNRWFNFIRCPPSASGSGPRHYVIINTKCCGPAYISRLRRCGRIQIKKRFYNRRISLENREKGTRNRTMDEDDAEAALRRSDGREAGVTAKRRQHLVLDDGGDIQLPQGRSRPTRTDTRHRGLERSE